MQEKPFEITIAPFAPGRVTELVEPSVKQSRCEPLQQHPRYISALQTFGTIAKTAQVRKGDQLVLNCHLLERRFFGIFTITMGFRGPHFATQTANEATNRVSSEEQVAALRFLKKHFSPWKRQFLQLMPELVDSKENRTLMKRAGFTRIMTGTSTIWIDLSLGEAALRTALAANWRNQLKKAERSSFTIAVGGAKTKHYNWLLERESEQRSNRGYSAVPLGLVPAYQDAVVNSSPKPSSSAPAQLSPIVSVTAHEKGTQIAGALFLLHGTSATYHIGWAGERGRALNAQNRVLFDGMLALKKRGVKWLDMGGVDTGPQAAIARFKLGLGHPPETLVGTYIG